MAMHRIPESLSESRKALELGLLDLFLNVHLGSLCGPRSGGSGVWLGEAVEERSSWLSYLDVEPRLDVLRHDPRFSELRCRVDLPGSAR